MKIEKIKYLIFASLILLIGCSKLLTAPEDNNVTDRPTTTISFEIRDEVEIHVLLYITNYNFELVKVLIDEELEGGYHSVVWNGGDYNNDPVASGVYYAFIITDDFASMLKMILIK